MLRIRLCPRRLFSLLAMMVALLIAAPALALTEGTLRGAVLDEDTLPIPGVNLTLSSEALIGGAQERLTDAHGSFHFVGLPPGEYQITASKAGFQAVTVTHLQVNVNRTTIQNITLPVTGVSEVVEVKGDRRAVDVEDTTRGEVLTKEFLQRIPTGRSYQSAVGLAAGV
ncbi:MAG: carboxypeptidase regulatory-like domain-containing protein, partial [Deltaproteobacteria bacterium]|nr:carboxypeptidase regulatory-like domain-containing protein [Deltaproteobacteria bacterium]MBW2257897.1 carboxypeptidase regulatory-like domain-containing protein [Deltaproteobacteria bacterium]